MILKSVTMRMMGVAVTPESEIELFLNYNIRVRKWYNKSLDISSYSHHFIIPVDLFHSYTI
jgi:hypothetical protein